MSVDAVLLDWGHTLFDTPGSVDFILAFAHASAVEIDRDEVHGLWDDARLRSRSASEIAKGRDKSAKLHRQCWMALWRQLETRCPGVSEALYEFETSAAGWSPYVDTAEVLQALSDRHIPVVIVSDVAFDLRPILRHYHLDQFVHTFVLSGEHGTIKPERKLFTIALNAVGVTPDRALMVGDNHINDGAAIDVGIQTLLLAPNGVGKPRGLQIVVDIVDAQR